MRTTVTLDADTEALLRKLMRERGISFKEALNQAVRSGIARILRPQAQLPFRQKTYSMGFQPEFRWDKALALADAMEDQERWRNPLAGISVSGPWCLGALVVPYLPPPAPETS